MLLPGRKLVMERKDGEDSVSGTSDKMCEVYKNGECTSASVFATHASEVEQRVLKLGLLLTAKEGKF